MRTNIICLVFIAALMVSCASKKPVGVQGVVKHFRFDPVPSPMPSKSGGVK